MGLLLVSKVDLATDSDCITSSVRLYIHYEEQCEARPMSLLPCLCVKIYPYEHVIFLGESKFRIDAVFIVTCVAPCKKLQTIQYLTRLISF